jgi:hypothetical protein
MRKVTVAFGLLTLSALAAEAQPGRAGAASQGSSVAYDQPVYYIQRLRPSRYYPPSRYGYVEVVGRPPAAGGMVRTGR